MLILGTKVTNRTAVDSQGARKSKKLLAKSSWFKKKGGKSSQLQGWEDLRMLQRGGAARRS